ncbi:Mov34/MPN/PAD-1 family protein [Paenibacillus sp. UMB4589-SE434]|uniref:Mov34/MPN/PAD-1 family protein n=1 Tax=Paenibacillus sp. UMB4589-SE434 TaxID=3046314 RepID=UPI00254CF8E2|nr:Mov34/MPN/PAD-1 family protein [Paenibacillus sp. UMB4589-SE434]MDK8181709.1 Mov34/MPN/PAD-1 family protein [Paenibacillus sp. UMB4589-SE434]
MMEYEFGDKLLVIKPEVVRLFQSYRQIALQQHEAGGILLGRLYGNEKVVIEQVSVPSRVDKSGRFFFDRNVKKAQQLVNQAWEDSNGEIRYLGEWHTHPESDPKPSSVDRKLLRDMLKDTKMDIDYLFLIIVGIERLYVASQHRGKGLQRLNEKYNST